MAYATVDGWMPTRLGDLLKVKHGWPFKTEHIVEATDGLPIVVNIGNFRYTGGFRFSETNVRAYNGPFPQEYILKPGDILVVMTCQTAGGEILGVPGRIADDGKTYLHNQRMGKLVITEPELLDAGYSYWLFMSPALNRHLYVTASGTKILHTAPERIHAYQFLRPPLEEQRAIASVLGALDDKIDLNRRMNETLEAMARAVYKSWFVDFDPVRAKAGGEQPWGMDAATAALFPDTFDDSELGEIPQGWRVAPLDSIATFLNGLALQNYPPTADGSLPVIKIAELRRGITESSNRASVDVPPQYIIEDGDVLFSWSGSLECVVWCDGRGALNQHLFKVTSDSMPPWFSFHAVHQHLPWFRAIASGKATTMGHIQRHHLKEALVVVPDENVLKAADERMLPLWRRVIANRLESRTLAELRDTLLPKLLSGEVRVGAAEKMVEVVS